MIKDFDFISSLGIGRGDAPDYLTAPREETDYGKDTETNLLLPPNALRGLVSSYSRAYLVEGFQKVCRRYPGRLSGFDLHLRGMTKENDVRMPWDVLTYTIFDGLHIYAPVNVSFSHRVMNARWDVDPDKNLRIQREIVERQIFDVTTHPAVPGLDIAIYGVQIPERFSHGNTNRIFMEYPSKDMITSPYDTFDEAKYQALREQLKCVKLPLTKESVIYLFPGTINRFKFNQIISDEAFHFYCREIRNRWEKNFSRELDAHLRDADFSNRQGVLAQQVEGRLLSQLGAQI